MVSLIWSLRLNTSIGSSAAPGEYRAVSTGSPNSMYHFVGSGTAPSGPSHGNSGATGKYGRPSSRASGLMSPTLGYISSAPTIEQGTIGTPVPSAADTHPPRPHPCSLYRSETGYPQPFQ